MQHFKVGQVWVDGGETILKYRILSIHGDNLEIRCVYSTTSVWKVGEEDVFTKFMCESDELDKEWNVKQLLDKIDGKEPKEKPGNKGSQQGNERTGKQKLKKGCKTCDSKGCRCNARGKRVSKSL